VVNRNPWSNENLPHLPPTYPFYIPDPEMLMEVQNQARKMGSAIKADRAYGRDELDVYFVAVSGIPPNTDLFDDQLTTLDNNGNTHKTSIAGSILHGSIMPDDPVWPFTGISKNGDGFALHGPNPDHMISATPSLWKYLTEWMDTDTVHISSVHEHLPEEHHHKDQIERNPPITPRQLDDQFTANLGQSGRLPTDPPGEDISLLHTPCPPCNSCH
jgi:hypothetical protein